jgi:integrase
MTPDYRPNLVRSFERHLRAENRSEHTIASYLESLRQAEAFLAGRGRSLMDARREDLEAPAGACAGKDFETRRDTAIVMFLLDTGARRAELADLQLTDLDWTWTSRSYSARAAASAPSRMAARPPWRSTVPPRPRPAQGRPSSLAVAWQAWPANCLGVQQLLRRRGDQAGLPGLHPHQLRHTFAYAWLAQGGGETDLMRLAGWRSRQMLGRYGAWPPIHGKGGVAGSIPVGRST